MSENAIEKYYNEIKEAELNGMNNEQNIREYFYELLKNYTNSQNLKIERETKEFVFENGQKKNIFLDGRIKKENMVIGWVENKDAKDDLNKEIKNKKEKQYPLLNTIFENSKELVLFQDGKEVIRVNMSKSEEQMGYAETMGYSNKRRGYFIYKQRFWNGNISLANEFGLRLDKIYEMRYILGYRRTNYGLDKRH